MQIWKYAVELDSDNSGARLASRVISSITRLSYQETQSCLSWDVSASPPAQYLAPALASYASVSCPGYLRLRHLRGTSLLLILPKTLRYHTYQLGKSGCFPPVKN